MFHTATNEKIGNHLADLIKQSKYKSDRQFGIAYFKQRYHFDPSPEEIQKTQNRICQIKKGNKGIQIEDLPIFSELLQVSIEDILSAGAVLAPISNRTTNYSIACSKDPSEWKAYLQREDKPVLNPDEFNKTIIDYALEVGNYSFLKYLMDSHYIWFVGNDPGEYYIGFGAGTSIERREIGFTDILDITLKESDDLRFKMITLAIKNNDFDVLDQLHARELPMLYTLGCMYAFHPRSDELPSSQNIDNMIQCIASSSKGTLNYFFENFEITPSRPRQESSSFIFPYSGAVLDIMIRQKNRNVSYILEKVITYNKSILKKLLQLTNNSIKNLTAFYESANGSFYSNSHYIHEAWKNYYFYPQTGFVAYTTPVYLKPYHGFITNVVHVTAKSSDSEIQFLIDELNETYDTFNQYFNKKENPQDV
ncbi:hypothetical protein [Simiaoa sunii]|jgi:hypothetical protein|uniref:Uncharacterized protein n=1 Tax=Simiaoa sunii TaxID=2763672 RepID=A0A7G9FYH1_9FIRM|nr:hypothetical protein [Simiaoa sunii]QNM03603.1 hypothetical protein H9Q77_05770 [Simiaoa sunii]